MTMQDREYQAMQFIYAQLKLLAPKDTWNLTNNGIRIVQVGPGSFEVRVGGETAPYGVTLNKEGIHKGWINKIVTDCTPTIRKIMMGALSREEIQDLIGASENKLEDTRAKHIARKERELASIV